MQRRHLTALPPLSLYVHLPWCAKKCPYCDFNSHEARGEVPEAAYVDALLNDLAMEMPLVWGRTLSSVFVGGGTPSLFSADALDRLLSGVRALTGLAPDVEVTLEANPGTVERGRFADYRAIGINRLSIGVQSLDDEKLRVLGRIHSADEARRAVAEARAAGFDDLNLDLMYALPGQDLAGAMRDVEGALALEPTHLSCYELTLEPNTRFAKFPPENLPDDDARFDMQEAILARLSRAGFERYEISAFARPGRRSVHNLNYWLFGDYLGIGAGAHAKLSFADSGEIRRRWKVKHPTRYLETAGTQESVGGGRRDPRRGHSAGVHDERAAARRRVRPVAVRRAHGGTVAGVAAGDRRGGGGRVAGVGRADGARDGARVRSVERAAGAVHAGGWGRGRFGERKRRRSAAGDLDRAGLTGAARSHGSSERSTLRSASRDRDGGEPSPQGRSHHSARTSSTCSAMWSKSLSVVR